MIDNNKRNTVETILEDKRKSALMARGPLSRLFRIILLEMNIGPMAWQRYMERYLNKSADGKPLAGKERSSARGNLNKQLTVDPMTFKNFLRAMHFLGALRIKFSVEIVRKTGTSVHSVEIDTKYQKEIDTLQDEDELSGE